MLLKEIYNGTSNNQTIVNHNNKDINENSDLINNSGSNGVLETENNNYNPNFNQNLNTTTNNFKNNNNPNNNNGSNIIINLYTDYYSNINNIDNNNINNNHNIKSNKQANFVPVSNSTFISTSDLLNNENLTSSFYKLNNNNTQQTTSTTTTTNSNSNNKMNATYILSSLSNSAPPTPLSSSSSSSSNNLSPQFHLGNNGNSNNVHHYFPYANPPTPYTSSSLQSDGGIDENDSDYDYLKDGWKKIRDFSVEIQKLSKQACKQDLQSVDLIPVLQKEYENMGVLLSSMYDKYSYMKSDDRQTKKRKESDKNAEKRKKRREATLLLNNVCRSCKTTDTPEWRKGPDGTKSLCNACGLHYAKIIKREASLAIPQITNSTVEQKESMKLNSILN